MLRQGPRTFSNRSHPKLTRLQAAAVNFRANPGRVAPVDDDIFVA